MLMGGEDRNRGAASALKTTQDQDGMRARGASASVRGAVSGQRALSDEIVSPMNGNAVMTSRNAGTAGPGVACEAQSDAEIWARVKRRLRIELGEDVYTSWFARLELSEIHEGCARLSVPTRFLKSWIEAHYLDRVLSIYKSESPLVVRLALSVRGAVAAFPGTNIALWSRARRGRQPLSAENYLLVCRLLSLDPYRFFLAAPKPPRRKAGRSLRDILKAMKKQAVTARVSREAGRVER